MKTAILIFGTILFLSNTLKAIEYDVDVKSQVVVLVNENNPESVAIGRYYAKRRNIPETQICSVKTVSGEIISWPEFREQILAPLKTFLASRPDVIYIVPVYGIPLKTKEENPENDIKKGVSYETMVQNRDYCCIDREIELLKIPHLLDGWLKNDLFAKEEKITTKHEIYIVSRLDGPTPESVRTMVDNALYGETYGVEGEYYLDTRGITDTNSTYGTYGQVDNDMKKIADVFNKYGFEIHHEDTNKVQDLSELKNISHYWGWYTGNIVSKNDFKFMPGAVGAHLHSFAANTLRSTDKNWTGPLIYHGIAGTCGTVYEPLSVGFPNGTIFFDRFLAGYTFGESMQMANTFTSWMAVFVGDPLYAPYARGRKEIQEENRKLAKNSHQQIIDLLNGNETEKAAELAEEIKVLNVLYQGLPKEYGFIVNEAIARWIAGKDIKGKMTVEEMIKYYEEGQELFKQGKYNESREKAKRVLNISPYNYECNMLFIKANAAIGNYGTIKDELEKAQKVCESSYDIHFYKGIFYKYQKKYEEALNEFRSAMEYEFNLDCYRNTGEVLAELKKYDESLKLLQEVSNIKKDSGLVLYLSRIYNGLNDYQKSIKILNETIKELPATPEELAEYKELFKQLLVSAKMAQDKSMEEMASAIVKDFEGNKVKTTYPYTKNNIDKIIDKTIEEKKFSPLGNLSEYKDKFHGLPRIFFADKSEYDINIYISGPSSLQLNLRAHRGKGKEKVVNSYIYPGKYKVVVIASKGNDKKIFYRECGVDISKNYSLSFDDKLNIYQAPH